MALLILVVLAAMIAGLLYIIYNRNLEHQEMNDRVKNGQKNQKEEVSLTILKADDESEFMKVPINDNKF